MRAIKTSICRGRIVLDMVYTWLEVREMGINLRAPLTYLERLFYLELRSVLRGQDLVVYDIGASIGNVTAMSAKLGNVSVVYAFEPILGVFSKLQHSVQRFAHVRCFNVAIGDVNGPAVFYQSDAAESSSLLPMGTLHKSEFPYTAHTVECIVQVARLDDLVSQEQLLPPDVVKIDVQGAEGRVLSGGEKTIRQTHYCVLEMSVQPLYEGSVLFHDLYERLRGWGFEFAGFAGRVTGQTGQILQVDGVFRKVHSD